ncbi:MAG: winged helix-turn-helix domain-containing protein [Spirosomaceae bacterium]|jgi:molybdate transport system regulatory protein|nr:winged helix-turn-helix domain-containing protein [Spirosomataceae bacterium]
MKLNGRIWIEESDKFIGIGRVELLELIKKTGSINKAAQTMNMSYKKAWGLVNSMNEQSSKPLVLTQTGGEKGGGATITDEAQRLIDAYKEIQERFKKFLSDETSKLHR